MLTAPAPEAHRRYRARTCAAMLAAGRRGPGWRLHASGPEREFVEVFPEGAAKLDAGTWKVSNP